MRKLGLAAFIFASLPLVFQLNHAWLAPLLFLGLAGWTVAPERRGWLILAAFLFYFPLEPMLQWGLAAHVVFLLARVNQRRVDARWGPRIVPFAGHALLAAGWLAATTPGVVSMLVGIALLATDSMWVRRTEANEAPLVHGWENLFLVLGGGLIGAATIMLLLDQGPVSRLVPLMAIAAMATHLRSALPEWLHGKTEGGTEFLLHAVAAAITSLALLVVVAEVASALIWPLFALFTAILLISVLHEYASSYHAWFSRAKIEPLYGPLPKISIVVAAKNEGATVVRSMRQNLLECPGMSFVAALSGMDLDSQARVRALQAEGGDVRIAVNCGLAKATDLTQTLATLQTEYAFLLDADELLTQHSLRLAVAWMEHDPTTAVVQGRKAASQPTGFWARFLAAERRFSTLVDQPFYADALQSAHFGGSAALIRLEAARAVGGWHATTLTEDIEFTLRLYRKGKWRVQYDARIVVPEELPTSFGALLRQRNRWARGWAEVARLHGRALMNPSLAISVRRRFGVGRQLLASVSAILAIMLPTLTLLWWQAGAPGIGKALGWALFFFIVPSRLVSYVTAWARETQDRHNIRSFLEAVIFGYLWIVAGWVLQLHALYLEVSGRPRTWQPTRTVHQSANNSFLE